MRNIITNQDIKYFNPILRVGKARTLPKFSELYCIWFFSLPVVHAVMDLSDKLIRLVVLSNKLCVKFLFEMHFITMRRMHSSYRYESDLCFRKAFCQSVEFSTSTVETFGLW